MWRHLARPVGKGHRPLISFARCVSGIVGDQGQNVMQNGLGVVEKMIFCEDSEFGVRMPLISVVGDQGQNIMHNGLGCPSDASQALQALYRGEHVLGATRIEFEKNLEDARYPGVQGEVGFDRMLAEVQVRVFTVALLLLLMLDYLEPIATLLLGAALRSKGEPLLGLEDLSRTAYPR